MKKSMLLLLVLAAAGLSSCQKEVTREVDQAFSTVYDIQPEDWTSSDNSLSYSTSLNIPELSQDIFDNGAVIVYLSFVDNIYEALPEVYEGISYGAIHGPGALTLDLHAVDGGAITRPKEDIYAKVVLINARALSLHPNLNLKDYNQVRNTLGLP